VVGFQSPRRPPHPQPDRRPRPRGPDRLVGAQRLRPAERHARPS
jgi:hypothetical protein